MSAGPPRGILKNRQSGDRNGQGQQDGGLAYTGFGSGGQGWGASSILAAPSTSVDLTSSLLHLESGSDRTLRSKLHEFVSRKGEMLFRPLASDEVAIVADRGEQGNAKDHFGVVPSLDFFLNVESSERRSHFYHTSHPGDIVLGELTSKTSAGLTFRLLCVEGSRSLYLEDLDIKGYCPVGQMIPAIHPLNPNKIFAPGDFVRCEILSVKLETEKLILGMKGNALSLELKHSVKLGLIFESDFPIGYLTARLERSSKLNRSYEELLDESHGFHNPNSVTCLASSMGILDNRNTFMTGLRGVFPTDDMASALRRQQNGKWAHGSVAEGIRYFKSGDLTEAFQCLNKALSIDAENVEGLVARGALYANKGSYEKAIEDFESALKYNPSHVNAKKYLTETLVALGKQQEENGKIEEAVGSYAKCLSLRPDHTEAKSAMMAIYNRYEKIDFAKLNPLARGRIIDLKEKMKNLLQNELKPKTIEVDETKKRKKKESSSDSSSSDSSDSDDDKKGKKKKKKKKKKSKKKKSKAKDKDELEVHQPLSPFSRRLAEGGGDLAGVVAFKDSAWTKSGAGEGEGKKKKKEKRKKKKRSSDSSSSSSTSDSDSEKRKKSKSKKKKKKPESDLGELEAKLSAYFSKVEQEKIAETVIQPVPAPNVDVKFRMDRHSESFERKEPVVTRLDIFPDGMAHAPLRERKEASERLEVTTSSEMATRGIASGKIELRTDEYGNFLNHRGADSFVRTVVNNVSEEMKPKFEMKIRAQSALVTPAEGINDEASKSEPASKWRKVGDPTSAPTYTVTRLDGSAKEKAKKEVPFASQIPQPPQGSLYVPPPTYVRKKEDFERNYRNRSRRTPSRSHSRSPGRRHWGRRDRRSRSHSRRRRSSSRSRSRSRSRSPRMRYRRRGSFRGFFRRRGSERFDRVQRTFLHDPSRGRGRRFPPSKMRNIFAHSRSRSRSRSNSKSRRRSRSGSPSNQKGRNSPDSSLKKAVVRNSSKSPEKSPKRRSNSEGRNDEVMCDSPQKPVVNDEKTEQAEQAEISIGSLTTTDASEVEKLLDQRNAEKKEEMKERNPDFFRNT